MADILNVFHYNIFTAENLFNNVKNITSQWFVNYSTNAKEKELLDILESLANLNYVNETIIQALEKFLKINGANIKEPEFVSALMKYCVKARIASPTILEFGAKYFRSKAQY